MGKRSDKCPICALQKEGVEGKMLLERIDQMIYSHRPSKSIISMCDSFNFKISANKLLTHKRYHLLRDLEEVTAEFDSDSFMEFTPEIAKGSQEEIVKDLITNYIQSVERQTAIALLSRSMKDEVSLSTSINNLLNTLSKCQFTIVNIDEFNQEISEIKQYLGR